MILFITSLSKVQACVLAIEEGSGEPVRVCTSFHDALGLLQSQEFAAVVVDQLLLDTQPDEGETVLHQIGSAVPVYLNLAVTGTSRAVREVCSAMGRRKREVAAAKKDAEQALHHELKDSITALLLSCEIALRLPDLPPVAVTKLQTVEALVREMSFRLGGTA